MRLAASFVKACIARSEELDIPIANGVCFEELMDVLVHAVDRRHEAGKLVRAVDSRCEAGQAGRMQDSWHEAGQPQKAQPVRAGQEMSKNVDSFSLK